MSYSEEQLKTLERMLREDLVTAAVPAGPVSQRELSTNYFQTKAQYSMLLPSSQAYGEGYTQFLTDLVDFPTKDILEQCGLINWCKTAKTLFPLKVSNVGDTLLASVARYIWGQESVGHTVLKDLLRDTFLYLSRDARPGVHLDIRWAQDWERMHGRKPDPNLVPFSTFMNPGAPPESRDLRSTYLFVLANSLRRPIIVYDEMDALTDNFTSLPGTSSVSGIYLPLLVKPGLCRNQQSPVTLSYSSGCFQPLVSKDEPAAYSGVNVLPLVNKQYIPLPIRFLLQQTELDDGLLVSGEKWFDSEVANLGGADLYLKLVDLPLTSSDSIDNIMCATMNLKPIPNQEQLPPGPSTQLRSGPSTQLRSGSPAQLHSGSLTRKQRSMTPELQPLGQSRQPASTGESSEEHWGDWEYVPSLVPELCRAADCNYMTSVSTHPYCHQCFSRRNPAQAPVANIARPTQGISVNTAPIQGSAAPQSTGVPTRASSTFCFICGSSLPLQSEDQLCCRCRTREGPLEASPCKQPGCDLYGLPKQNGYCSQCWKEQAPVGGNTGSREGSLKIKTKDSGRDHDRQQRPADVVGLSGVSQSSRQQPAQSQFPVSSAIPMHSHPQVRPQTRAFCSKEGCTAFADPERGGYCQPCSLKSKYAPLPGYRTEYPLMAQHKPKNREVPPAQCVAPYCNNVATEAGKMCSICYETLAAANRAREDQLRYSVEDEATDGITSLCAVLDCSATIRDNRTFCDAHDQSNADRSVKQCSRQFCGREALVGLQSLCFTCYQDTAADATSSPGYNSPSYGNPLVRSRPFSGSRTAETHEETIDGFGSDNDDVISCCVPLCNNLGTIRNNGYCDTCSGTLTRATAWS